MCRGECVERRGRCERVAGAASQLDRTFGARKRLRHGVVGRALHRAERVAEHPGLCQCHRRLGGRVVASQLPRSADQGDRFFLGRGLHERAREPVCGGGGGGQVHGGAGAVPGTASSIRGGAVEAVHVIAARATAGHLRGLPEHGCSGGGVVGERGRLLVSLLRLPDQMAGERQLSQPPGQVIGVRALLRLACRPSERCAELIGHRVEPGPPVLPGHRQVDGLSEAPAQVPDPGDGQLTGLAQPFRPVLADGLQGPVAGALRGCRHPQQALLGKSGQSVGDHGRRGAGDLGRCRYGEGRYEDRHAVQELLVDRFQQSVTPVQHGAD